MYPNTLSFRIVLFAALFAHASYGQSFDPCESAEDGELVRGPVSCSHYIICDADEPSEDYCENGQVFSPDIQDCDDPDEVDCSEYGSEEESSYEDETEEEESEEEESEESEEATNDISGSSTSTTCPRNDDPSKVVFLPSRQSCSEYHLCYHGLPLSMHCTNSLHFNVATNRCDFPKNANCRVGYENGAITTTPRCDRSIFIEMYPHPTQCDYYYYCRKGYLSIQQCPFNFYFDATTKTCRIRTGYEC